jgi:hypothetical protein
MFVRNLILFCLAFAVLAPLADAKSPNKHPKPNHGVKKAKINKSKSKFGTYKVKKQKPRS